MTKHPMKATDMLDAVRIRRELAELGDGLTIEVYPELDSTNNEAKRRARAGDRRRLLIVADRQSGGRGRLGRSFFSPAGAGIYMTYLWHPNRAAVDAVSVTTAASVAVVRALHALPSLAGRKPGIKWVNDIYLDGKKVCGILTEAVSDGEGKVSSLLIGIGINVHPTAFPPELADIATCLGETGADRSELIACIMRELLRILHAEDAYEHMSYYKAHSIVLGKQVHTICGGVSIPGTVLDIDATGGLVVKRPDGSVETIHSGEVSLRM